jgi:glycosyltransferase involved in cell wall biosynthesis
MIRSNPSVSVVIPTRNRSGLLMRAVRSALAQTLQDIEVIVVIDGEEGSQSADAVAHLEDPRVRCVALRDQVGGAEARNIGIREARSSLIALLDDDDEWLPAKLEIQTDAIRRSANNHLVVVTCQHLHRVQGAADVVRPRRLPRPDEPPCEFMFDYLCYFQTSTFVCSRELMLKVPFTKGLPFFHDIDWFLRAFGSSEPQLVVVARPLSVYYVPEKRVAISNGVDWKAKVNWGRASRHLMSKRAYSRFIVGSCVGAAVQDGAGLAGFARLFYESAFVGSPTPPILLILCGAYVLRPAFRKKLRDLIFLKRSNLELRSQRNADAKVI